MIQSHFRILKNHFKEFKSEKTNSLRHKKAEILKRDIESVRQELDLFEMELENWSDQNKKKFSSFFCEINEKLIKMRDDVGHFQYPMSFQTTAVKVGQMASDDIGNMNKEQLVFKIDKALDEADEDCLMILKDLSGGKEMMAEIQREIQDQEERLIKMKKEIEEMYSISKQTKKMVTYFKTQVMKDKIIILLFVLVMIALITVVGLKLSGYKVRHDNNQVNLKDTIKNNFYN